MLRLIDRVWMEILALSGNPDASFRHLARAWGRDKGFHMVLAQFICERRGDVERKKRERQMGNPDLHAVWDPDATSYGDVYDEALASDLLSFSQQVQASEQQVPPYESQQRHNLFLQPQRQHHHQQQNVGRQQHHNRVHKESFDQEQRSYASSPMNSSVDDEELIKSETMPLQHGNYGPNGEYYPV